MNVFGYPNFSFSFLTKDQLHDSTKVQKKGSLKSGIGLYGHDMNGFDDAELEAILSNMSPEELEDLNCDFDPDVSKFISVINIIVGIFIEFVTSTFTTLSRSNK